jgi:hypothetical protein
VPAPDLRNLAIYHDIGLGLDVENFGALDDAAYVAVYREKLAEWHDAYPIEPDARLWRGGAAEVTSIDAHRAVA